MRQLLPSAVADVDPVALYLGADRPSPAGRPWVAVGMVQSLDGATAIDGRSGALGGDADKAVFRAVRAIADVIVVAAGTARAEDYGPVQLRAEVRDARVAAGRSPEPPRLAVVTASLDLDPESRLFADPDRPPIILTGASGDPDRRRALEAVAEVRTVGDEGADLERALASLADDGAAVVVCEGGPSLNGALASAGLVDEWCCSIAPTVAAGDSKRIVAGADAIAEPETLELASLLEGDGVLFGRWVRSSRT